MLKRNGEHFEIVTGQKHITHSIDSLSMEEREKENLLFQHHVAASQQKQRKQHPSFAAIPKFFSSSATSGPSSSGSFPSLASSLASNHVSSLFWLESFSRHLESEVSTMLGYRRPLLVARSASASDIPYRDMEEEWRGTIREMEFELRSVCLPFLDELASAQSPPLEDKSLRINYETFQHLREESQHPFFQRLMTGRTFLKFSRDKYGRISTENLRRYLYNAHFKCVQMLDLSFFAHISALNSVTIAQQAQQEQLDKQQHQKSPSHSPRAATPVHAGTLPVSPLNPATFAQKLLLSEDDIMKWIRSRLMHDTACPLLRPEHEDDFFGIYVFTSARRFLFFLDPKKRRQVSVQKLLESSLTAEFLDFAHLIHNTDWPDSPSLSGEGAGGGDDASSIGGDSSSAAERIDNPHSRHYVQHHSIIEDISEWAQSSRRFVSYFVGTRPAPLRHAPIPTSSSGSSSSDHGLSGAHVGVNSSSNINRLPSQNQNKDLGTSSNGNGGGSSGGVGRDNFTPPIPPSLAASTSSAVASSNGEETASSAAAVNASSLDYPNPTHRGQPSTATGGALRDVVMMLFTPTLTPHREQVAATLRDAIVNSGVAIQQPPEPSPCVPSSSRVLSGPVPRIDTEHPGVASLEPKRVDWVLRPIVEESSSSSTGNDSASLKDDEVQSSDNVDEPFDRPHNSCLRVSLFQTNWFSADTPNSYYREYLELDRDENGMISKQELSLFRRQ